MIVRLYEIFLKGANPFGTYLIYNKLNVFAICEIFVNIVIERS